MIPLFSLDPIKEENKYIRRILTPNGNKFANVFTDDLKLIAGADSIHDFFDTVRVPNDVFINVSNNLIANLKILYPTTNVQLLGSQIMGKDGKLKNPSANDPYKTWLENLSDKKITASDLEKKTEVYFENKYPKFLLGNVVKLTYRQVIAQININITLGQDNNTAIYNAYMSLCYNRSIDTIEIDMEPGEIWDTAYSTTDKTFIGLFLLNFFFTPQPLIVNQGSSTQEQIDVAFNTKKQTYMTFDANSNIPTKIFGLLDQVINLVTPLNIADSASDYHHLVVDTSQKRASVKNKYVFPLIPTPSNVQIPTSADKQVYLYNSNIYTMSDGVNLYIEKPQGEYGEKNKYDFKVYASKFISNNNNGNIEPCEILHFTNADGTTYSSGPGVKYLSNMIDYNGRTLPKPEPSNSEIAPLDSGCMNKFDLTNKPKALYYDLKRSGDWEQCMAALTVNKLMTSGNDAQKGRVILCTLDRLCALFSRSIGQNAIYHTGTKLHLYRYAVNLTPEEIDRNARNAEQAARLQEEADRDAAVVAQQAAAEAAILLVEKQEGANIIKRKISTIMSQLKQPLENYLTENIFIEKLKVSNSLNNNIYKMINFFARILFIKSLKKLIATTNIADPQGYFDSLNEITDSLVTPSNYEPFIDNITKYITAFVGVNVAYPNQRLLLRGKLGDYDSEKLIELYSNLKSINKEITRDSKSITKHNYKKKLEKEGVFSILELILRDLEPEENSQISLLPPAPPSNYFEELKDFVNKFKEQPYNNNSNVQPTDFTESNKAYYGNLKSIIQKYSVLIPPTINRGGSEENQYGGDLSDKEQQERQEQKNGYKSLMLELTNEFMSLSVSLNEITESIAKNNTETNWGNMNYKGFILKMKTLQLNEATQTTGESSSAMEVENEIDYTNKILEILEVFFENSWKAIEIAELNAIDTNNHKNLYYTIYTYFACLYGDIIGDVNNPVVKDILAKNYFLKSGITETRSSSDTPENKKKRILEDSDSGQSYSKKSKNDSSSSKIVTVSSFLLEITFFNDYIKDDYYNYITTILNNNNVWFNNIIRYCITARFQENKRNNFALTVFTTLLNFFKYCIYYRVKGANNEIPNMLNLNNYGFNNGFLVLNDIKDGTTDFGKFFNKLINFTSRNNGSINIDDYEIIHQRIIFLRLPVILSILSSNFINPDQLVYQLNELKKIRGGSGKYTRKKYKSKSKKMKTRKNNTRNKNLKRRKTQKRIHKRRPQKTRSNKWD
jgi:hypothetical protein